MRQYHENIVSDRIMIKCWHRQDSLTAHNTYRAKHGVPALKLNDELNALAQVLFHN